MLERGITVLSLEHLLGSRTVFSAITTPLSLRTANILTPCLIFLWILSPIGGQATFRLIDIIPATVHSTQNLSYLELMSAFPHTGPFGSAGPELLPPILGAFYTALSSSAEVKAASQDTYGNIKIPMIETLQNSGGKIDKSGWQEISGDGNLTYSAITGIPVSGYGAVANYTFTLETSYMYTNCTTSHVKNMSRGDWDSYMEKHSIFNNYHTLVIEMGNNDIPARNRTTPLELIFTSFTDFAVTNATCKLTTTYIEVEIYCYHSICKSIRARPSTKPRDQAIWTVLEGMSPFGAQSNLSNIQPLWYLSTLVNATNTPWDYMWTTDPHSTPLEYYFANPDSPYSTSYVKGEGIQSWRGADIWPIGDELFSKRFSQLLNKFWITNIAPSAFMNKSPIQDVLSNDTNSENDYNYLNITGNVVPDYLQFTYKTEWLALLVGSSVVMLFASLISAFLGLLRRGPDVLDRVSLIMRDNPHVRTEVSSSMEDGFDQARRLKNTNICLGDARDGEDRGHVAVSTVDAVVPMSRVKKSRLYD